MLQLRLTGWVEWHPLDGFLMALVAWTRRMRLMPRTRPPYPPEFRREAVQLVLAGRTVKDVAGSLGCSEQSLHNWVRQQRDILKRAAVLFAAETETR